MSDRPENPPPRIDEPTSRRSIRRVDKPTSPIGEHRPTKMETAQPEAPGWRRWLSSKLV